MTKEQIDRSEIRYQADESPPRLLAIGLGLQLAIVCIAGVVLTPAIVINAAGEGDPYLTWAVFAAVLICGITTIVQAVRVGRIGAGYVLLMGTSGAFIAVCITAIVEGGPAMLAVLVVISACFQFLLSARLALFRRILTQTVAGTVIMLIAVTVMPIIFDMFQDVPEGSAIEAGAVTASVTVAVIVAVALKATGALRLWAPVIGVIAGSVVGGFYGLYDLGRIADAAWIGIPTTGWPGFDLEFGATFWMLLPAFVFVTLVGAIETIGDAVAIQKVSWRTRRAVDYQSVQGAVAADGLGNLLSGLVGTVPNTTYSTSVSVTELTGVGSRTIGVWIGIVFIALAFLPKALATIVAIPQPVAGGYLIVLLCMLFIVGMKIVIQDGITYQKGLIAGIAFWVGVGFQNNAIFPELLTGFAGGILQNGMTAGGLTAVALTLFMELKLTRRAKIETDLNVTSLPALQDFIGGFARRSRLDDTMLFRLETAVEETVLTLIGDGEAAQQKRRLLLVARKDGNEAVLELVASASAGNLEDQISLLSDQPAESAIENEVSLRVLRHISSSVHHQRYHTTDVVTVHVRAPSARQTS